MNFLMLNIHLKLILIQNYYQKELDYKCSDIEAVLDVLLRLSQLVNDFPEIVELDINPLLAFVKGYSAVDIKITIKR